MSDKKNRIVIGDDEGISAEQNRENLAKEKAKARLKEIADKKADEKNARRVVVLGDSDAKKAAKRLREEMERRKRKEIQRLRGEKEVYVIGGEETEEKTPKNEDTKDTGATKNNDSVNLLISRKKSTSYII